MLNKMQYEDAITRRTAGSASDEDLRQIDLYEREHTQHDDPAQATPGNQTVATPVVRDMSRHDMEQEQSPAAPDAEQDADAEDDKQDAGKQDAKGEQPSAGTSTPQASTSTSRASSKNVSRGR